VTKSYAPSRVSIDTFADTVVHKVGTGSRFAGLFAIARGADTVLMAVLDNQGTIEVQEAIIPAGRSAFPSLSGRIASAAWYEREIRDLFGLELGGHTSVESLVFPFAPGSKRPRLGSGFPSGAASLDLTPLAAHLHGEGVFTISYGPVRSGVFESIEYVVETPGEDIPYLRPRVYYKHRGVEARFETMSVQDGVLLAERCEGVASVAHAVAFCGAIEEMGNVEISTQAGLVRVVHAELERIANHLDSTIRHTEAAGQAVAFARFSLHKERVQCLRAQLCGSRFGRGVVVPGGVASAPLLSATQIVTTLGSLETAIDADATLLMSTPSFLDRLRGTGVLSEATVTNFGALGPVARGSGMMQDVRWTRPYGEYARLSVSAFEVRADGDALARQRVRNLEIKDSFHLIRQCVQRLDARGEPEGSTWTDVVPAATGTAIGLAEAPQGEVLSLVEFRDGQLIRVKPRSASFHNLALFPSAFPNDILTDFAFIEASFGLSIAGVAS
jgi:formate hydrogenlyase subunit 5